VPAPRDAETPVEHCRDRSILADPDDSRELDWTQAVVGLPPRKQDIHIRIDADVLTWFKESGEGYQTRINSVLRAFFRAASVSNPVRGLTQNCGERSTLYKQVVTLR
jgi:uncharacterized protein (DUF4415 family)